MSRLSALILPASLLLIGTACLKVDVVAPRFVRPGKTFEATMTARSDDGTTASNVTACAFMPEGFSVQGVRGEGETTAGPRVIGLTPTPREEVIANLGSERVWHCWTTDSTAIARGTVTFTIAVAKGTPEQGVKLGWALYTGSTSGTYTTEHVIQKKKDKSGSTAIFAEDSLF